MDAELKAKWTAALRSGKYQQADGSLKDGDAFCCLGVLADIQGCAWEEVGPGEVRPLFNNKIVGKIENDDEFAFLDPEFAQVRFSDQKTLAEMNDSDRTFADIADYIDENL